MMKSLSWRALPVILSLSLGAASVSSGQVQDEPDFGKEARFHEIFKKYNEQPTSDEDWSRVFTDQKPKIYSVNKGDTLWDVSKVLFADPLFWPKIWSFNTDSILNPHEIKPGWKLQFLAGTLEQAPALVVVEVEGMKIPGPLKKYPPVTAVPPSLPDYRFNLPIPEKARFKKLDRSALSRPLIQPLPVQIFDNRPEAKGEVVEFDDDSGVASESRDIYVRLDDELAPGKYTIAKSISRSRYGYIVVYGGEIETTEKINDSDNIYRAKIVKMINPIETGDDLILGLIPDVDLDETDTAKEAPLVRIVGGYRSPTDSLFAAYSFVFISAGADEGLVEGETLNVYQDPKVRISKSKIKKAFRQVGQVKLLKVGEEVSTGYVTNATSEILEGDLAGVIVRETLSGTGESDSSDELILD